MKKQYGWKVDANIPRYVVWLGFSQVGNLLAWLSSALSWCYLEKVGRNHQHLLSLAL